MKRALLLLLLISCSSVPSVTVENHKFEIEIARTSEEHQKGLMFRESMPENHGMLFIFDGEQEREFWMKNTLIPLDMLFIGKDMKVVEIKADVPQCITDPCPIYKSKPAKYVLEINGGAAEKNGIKLSSEVVLRE